MSESTTELRRSAQQLVITTGEGSLVVLVEPKKCSHCGRMAYLMINRGSSSCVDCDAKKGGAQLFEQRKGAA